MYVYNQLILGTRGYEAEEKDRPQFRGDSRQPLKRSFITNRKETFFPEGKRYWLSFYSMVAVSVVIILSLGFLGTAFYAQFIVYKKYPKYKFPGYYVYIMYVYMYLYVFICIYIYTYKY
jgi:hypothetical protein